MAAPDNGVAALSDEIIETHLCAVNDDTFMNGIRQDQLLRNVQYSTAFRQEGIHTRFASIILESPIWYSGGKNTQRLSGHLQEW